MILFFFVGFYVLMIFLHRVLLFFDFLAFYIFIIFSLLFISFSLIANMLQALVSVGF